MRIMGATFSSIFYQLFGKKQCKIAMVGLDAAGKTTILYKIKTGEVIKTIPGIGFNVETVEYKNISFTVWDIGAGGFAMRPLWRHYYKDVDAAIFVVDSSDYERIQEAREEVHRMNSYDDLKDAVLLIFANKQDVPGAMSVSHITEKLGLNFIRDKKHVQPASAIKGEGLFEGFDWISTELSGR